MNLLVSVAIPNTEPTAILVTNPIPGGNIGDAKIPPSAPNPIRGSFFFIVLTAFPKALSSPNKLSFIFSFWLAYPNADPTIIPNNGLPGINGKNVDMPPITPPNPMRFPYVVMALLIFSGNFPEL